MILSEAFLKLPINQGGMQVRLTVVVEVIV